LKVLGLVLAESGELDEGELEWSGDDGGHVGEDVGIGRVVWLC
jgi:hypothetical protein